MHSYIPCSLLQMHWNPSIDCTAPSRASWSSRLVDEIAGRIVAFIFFRFGGFVVLQLLVDLHAVAVCIAVGWAAGVC